MRLVRLKTGLCFILLLITASTAWATDLRVPKEEQRPPAQTFLTFPEWFLVFSPNAYADLLEAHQGANRFPWFRHISQFWGAYWQVIQATRRYPFNGEYHIMILVIGLSTTVEYALRGTYETLFGRLSELTAPHNDTPEDQLATSEARHYVDFIRIHPWYEFDFVTPLKTLWKLPLWGDHPLRKWERRYLLTSEWGVKAGYAALLQWTTHATFERPAPTTFAVVTGLRKKLPPGVVLKQRRDKEALLALPRYQPFTKAALALANEGVDFSEIAGNRGSILVSLVVPSTQANTETSRILIRQPIITRPGYERCVLEVHVNQLASLLRHEAAQGIVIEHIFDY